MIENHIYTHIIQHLTKQFSEFLLKKMLFFYRNERRDPHDNPLGICSMKRYPFLNITSWRSIFIKLQTLSFFKSKELYHTCLTKAIIFLIYHHGQCSFTIDVRLILMYKDDWLY